MLAQRRGDDAAAALDEQALDTVSAEADKKVAPIMAEEIVRVATLPKRPAGPAPWKYPARQALLAMMRRRATASAR